MENLIDTFCATHQPEPELVPQQDSSDGGYLLMPAPCDKEGAFRLLQMIHSQKVEYLKKAIFELQRQNAVLNSELAQCREDRKSNKNLDVDARQTVPNRNQHSSGDSEKVQHLEKEIMQLEKEVDTQKLLVQHLKLKVKFLLDHRVQLQEKFKKKLKLEKKRASSEVQALLLEEKAKHLLSDANHGIQRSKQLELFVSTFHERFQDLLLTVQAKSSQNRITAVQRINELERNLSKSLGSL